MKKAPSLSKFGGFTLIELLIVVAIIAILAAIAVPNFLEAQIRAKCSRAKSDMRTLATGMEAYFVDHNTYYAVDRKDLRNLTSPVAYLSSIPMNVFGPWKRGGAVKEKPDYPFSMGKAGAYGSWHEGPMCPSDTFMFESDGPDMIDDTGGGMATGKFPWEEYADNAATTAEFLSKLYDPTNGSKSGGQIFRFGGAAIGFTQGHKMLMAGANR